MLCKTMLKRCFAPSVPCVVFFFLSKPKIKKHAALPLMPGAAQSDRLTPPQLALRPPPPLPLLVQVSRFCAVVMKSSNRQGSSLPSNVSLEPVRTPPFVTSVSMTNFRSSRQFFFFLILSWLFFSVTEFAFDK